MATYVSAIATESGDVLGVSVDSINQQVSIGYVNDANGEPLIVDYADVAALAEMLEDVAHGLRNPEAKD